MPDSDNTSPEPDNTIAANTTYLCFDYGARKTGVAVGQLLTRTATPVETINYPRDRVDYDRIAALIEEWNPAALVVGLPLTEDGTEQETTARARRFARQLRHRFGHVVHFAEERYSSRAAQDRFRNMRKAGAARRGAAGREDAVAAQIILENWLEQQPA